tara:strand:+ start:711 stop:1610 length:900 start_codon:yes stop_codon:yes gene_type:complete
MKYTYFSTERGGRLHYDYSALMNGKSVARIKGSSPNCSGLFCTIFMPKNNTRQWYWVDNNNNIRHASEHRRYDNIDWIGTVKDHKKRKKDNLLSKHWIARKYSWVQPKELEDDIIYQPHNLYKVFDKFFECDHITHPEVLLGYYGYTKPDREGLNMNDMLEQDIRYLNVDLDYSIDQLRKRKNIVVYKEDIRHWARSWFLGGGHVGDDYEEYYNMIACRLNEARRYPMCIQIVLDRYNIPYEMWSLDSGNYNIFGFDKNLSRYETEDCDSILKEHLHYMVDGWIDRYVSEYPSIFRHEI